MVLQMSLLAMIRIISYILMLLIGIFGFNVIFLNYLVVVLNFFVFWTLTMSLSLNLNWSRNMYSHTLNSLIIFITISILTFSIIYFRKGLIIDGDLQHSYQEAIYFSISMFTALGYGQVLPL